MLTAEGGLADALSRLEAILGRSGAAIVSVLHAGIRPAEVSRLLGGVGLEPSAEIVTWFGWHDGAGRLGMPRELIEIVPGGEFHGLDHLCGQYLQARSIAEEVTSMPGSILTADDLWNPSWLPLLRLSGKGFIVADLSDADRAASPVHVVWLDDEPARRARVAWPSVGAFAVYVSERYEAGTYAVDDEGIVQGPTVDYPG